MKSVCLKDTFAGLDRAERIRKYRELWHAAGRYEVLIDYPLHLDLELSGICNLDCEGCFQNSLSKRDLGLMSEEMFRSIIDEGVPRGLCSIKLQIRGESFLHPKLFEFIRYAKDAGVVDVQITTNGTLLTEKAIDNVLSSGLDGIIFSVDVRHEIACSQTQNYSNYSQVHVNVRSFLERRHELGRNTPWVRLKASTDDASPTVLNQLKKDLETSFPLADIHIVGTVFDYRKDHDSLPGLRDKYLLLPCHYPMQRLAVFWDGQTSVCCMDYHTEFGLGSLADASITKIWQSGIMTAFRKMHKAGKRETMPICRHCHACIEAANDSVYVDQTRRNLLDRDPTG